MSGKCGWADGRVGWREVGLGSLGGWGKDWIGGGGGVGGVRSGRVVATPSVEFQFRRNAYIVACLTFYLQINP